MALVLEFVNKSGQIPVSDYEVKVRVTILDGDQTFLKTIAIGAVKGHKRSNGWEELVRLFLTQWSGNPPL